MAKISDTAYEELRLILEKQYGQKFTPEETKEIGEGLIDFFTLILELTNEDHKSPSG
jgi:hypothetical protein